MNVIIHDLTDLQFQLVFPNITEEMQIISNNGCIKNCVGCFGAKHSLSPAFF